VDPGVDSLFVASARGSPSGELKPGYTVAVVVAAAVTKG